MLSIAKKEEAELSLSKVQIIIFGLVAITFTACDGIIPSSLVWLRKVDFMVDPQANRGHSFACHIVVGYSQDLADKLAGMADAKAYFTQVNSLVRTYKDNIQIFKFDLIPGRNRLGQPIKLRSYFKAKGAFIFAKYTTPGKYMENIGLARTLTVLFLPNKMELHSDISFDKLAEKIRRN